MLMKREYIYLLMIAFVLWDGYLLWKDGTLGGQNFVLYLVCVAISIAAIIYFNRPKK